MKKLTELSEEDCEKIVKYVNLRSSFSYYTIIGEWIGLHFKIRDSYTSEDIYFLIDIHEKGIINSYEIKKDSYREAELNIDVFGLVDLIRSLGYDRISEEGTPL